VRKTHDYIHHYRGYWSEGDRWLAAVGQPEHQPYEHGRVPGGRGHRGALPAHALDLDRALPRAPGGLGGVVVGEVRLVEDREVNLGGVWHHR
jgi:hypothetical protein